MPALTHPCRPWRGTVVTSWLHCVLLCSQRVTLIISVSKTHLFHQLFHRLQEVLAKKSNISHLAR